MGLTGGIATGKSTLRKILENRFNYVFLDADEIAREVVLPGTKGLERVKNAFGSEILLEKGELNRRALGEIIAKDHKKRALLNEILHPLIKERYKEQLERYRKLGLTFLIFDCPLLFEAKMESSVDEVILVVSDLEIRIKRIMERDSVSEALAIQKIEMQMPDSEKIKKADIIIKNNGTKEDLLIVINQYFTDLKPWVR